MVNLFFVQAKCYTSELPSRCSSTGTSVATKPLPSTFGSARTFWTRLYSMMEGEEERAGNLIKLKALFV